ncbi:MAG: hypothetical protein MJZ64_01080 [Paludibacteraceae bacterium]|nr:hypothetical protein [Paludibacteraceae bacterium]
MKTEDFIEFRKDPELCRITGDVFLRFSTYQFSDSDTLSLTYDYLNWHNYKLKLGKLQASNYNKQIDITEYVKKSSHYSSLKYKTMRRIVQFFDKHIDIVQNGAPKANALYDALFGKGNWERQSAIDS